MSKGINNCIFPNQEQRNGGFIISMVREVLEEQVLVVVWSLWQTRSPIHVRRSTGLIHFLFLPVGPQPPLTLTLKYQHPYRSRMCSSRVWKKKNNKKMTKETWNWFPWAQLRRNTQHVTGKKNAQEYDIAYVNSFSRIYFMCKNK